MAACNRRHHSHILLYIFSQTKIFYGNHRSQRVSTNNIGNIITQEAGQK